MREVLRCVALALLIVKSWAAQKEVYTLYRAAAPNPSALRSLLDLQINDHLFNVDFWKEPRGVADPADVMVPESLRDIIEKHFDENRIQYNVTVPDVEKLILRNEGRHSNLGFGKRLNDDPILDSEPDDDWSKVGRLRKARYPFGDYAPYADMMKYMRTIEFYYPSFTKIIRIGTTHGGKPIEGLKIGFPIHNKTKRAIWIDGNIHAREWASSHTALYIINQLVSGFKKDENITHYVNNLNFFIVPCLNPDGYEYTRSSPTPGVRLWRKNRSPEVCAPSLWGGEKCCEGVDLNRNFDFHWAETGSSYEPCSNLYHGDNVFSEPEASSVKRFLSSEEMWGRVDAFLTLHTYAQLWIYPFSHQVRNYPRDIDDLRITARNAVERLENVYGTVYRMGTGADTLAPASGGSDDWAKAKMNIKFVYLLELRPEEHLSHGFILHKKELIPTGIETLEGLKEVFEAVLEHNHIKRDPLAKISDAMRRKQDLRLRLLNGQREVFHTTPRTTIWTRATSPITTTTSTTTTTTTTRTTTTTATTTTTSTTTSTTSTTPSTTTSTTSTTTASTAAPTTEPRVPAPHVIPQRPPQLRPTATDVPQDTTRHFRRPTIPIAPPTFSVNAPPVSNAPPTFASFVNQVASQGERTHSVSEAERLRLKELAKQKEMEERKREVEETRRRVKAIEARKLREAERKKQREEEQKRKEDERRITEEARRRAAAEEEERKRIEARKRQEEEWRRDNARRLEAIKLRDEEDRKREQERVLEQERAQTEKALQRQKADSEVERVRRRLEEPRSEGGVGEEPRELLEAHPDIPSRPLEATVSVMEITVAPPVPQTATSPIRVLAQPRRVFHREEIRVVTVASSEEVVGRESRPRPTFAAPRITQRWDRRYTTTAPPSFRDPSCRDLRYSCAFWLRNSPDACVTQRSFMRAQCAYTCRFCESTVVGPISTD